MVWYRTLRVKTGAGTVMWCGTGHYGLRQVLGRWYGVVWYRTLRVKTVAGTVVWYRTLRVKTGAGTVVWCGVVQDIKS